MKREELKRKNRREKLIAFRNIIGRLRIQQDREFKKACKQLKVDPDGNQGDLLFDFFHNGPLPRYHSMIQIEETIWPVQAATSVFETGAAQ